MEALSILWPSLENHIAAAAAAAAAAKSLQSFATPCDSIDGSPPGSPVPGILQARTLERVAISFSNAWKWKVRVKLLSRARLLATPWTAAYQAPPSMGFSRQGYWSGVPLPPPKITLFLPYFVGQKRQKPQSRFQGRIYRIHLVMGGVWVISKKNIWKIHSATGKWFSHSKYIDIYVQSFHYNCSKTFIVLMITIL